MSKITFWFTILYALFRDLATDDTVLELYAVLSGGMLTALAIYFLYEYKSTEVEREK